MSIEYKLSPAYVEYPDALAAMEHRVEDMIAGRAPEMLWFLEHPPLYTSGTSAKPADLIDRRFPVYDTGRGGEWTYHGPGQRVVYAMLDLKNREAMDVRCYVQNLEQWIIATLGEFGIEGFTREGRIGVWVNENGSESKIAALGIRVRKWITYHGIALNLSPDLSHYAGIVPCGIQGYGVTSLKQMGVQASLAQVDEVLKREFKKIF